MISEKATKNMLCDLEQQLFMLSCDIGELSSKACLIEEKADDLRATVHDLRYKLKISEEWTE